MEKAKLAPKVKMGFTTKGKKELSPSLNLAIEPVTVSLPAYLKAVKELYAKNKQCHYREFGTIQTAAGEGKLTEIDMPTKFGPARLLQMIYLRDGEAYILTAAAHKDELPEFYDTFQAAFRSFTLNP